MEVIYTALWIFNNEVPPEQWLLHADDSVFSVFSVILQRVKGKNKAKILFTFYGKNISNLNVTLQKWIIFYDNSFEKRQQGWKLYSLQLEDVSLLSFCRTPAAQLEAGNEFNCGNNDWTTND